MKQSVSAHGPIGLSANNFLTDHTQTLPKQCLSVNGHLSATTSNETGNGCNHSLSIPRTISVHSLM